MPLFKRVFFLHFAATLFMTLKKRLPKDSMHWDALDPNLFSTIVAWLTNSCLVCGGRQVMSIPYIISIVLSPILGFCVDKIGKRATLATAAYSACSLYLLLSNRYVRDGVCVCLFTRVCLRVFAGPSHSLPCTQAWL